MEKNSQPHRVEWIDCARGIAIMAVVLDHTLYRHLPNFWTSMVFRQLFFSVPWFFFLFGITSVLSIEKHQLKGISSIFTYYRRRIHLVGIYVLASVIMTVLKFSPVSLVDIKNNILLFQADEVYYFFFILFQYLLIFPFLYIVLRIKKPIIIILTLVVSVIIAKVTNTYVAVPYIIPPYRSLLGGWFFLSFVFGIFYALYEKRINTFVFVVSCFVVIAGEYMLVFKIDPSIPSLRYTLSYIVSVPLLLAVKPLFQWTRHSVPLKIAALLGRNSLSIFLFHNFIVSRFYPMVSTPFIALCVTFIIAITAPLGLSLIYTACKRKNHV